MSKKPSKFDQPIIKFTGLVKDEGQGTQKLDDEYIELFVQHQHKDSYKILNDFSHKMFERFTSERFKISAKRKVAGRMCWKVSERSSSKVFYFVKKKRLTKEQAQRLMLMKDV